MKGAPVILGPNGQPAIGADRVRLEKSQRFNPLANWTPDVLTRQLTAFARGEIRDLAWVMEWLEQHDDTISAVAPKAKSAVSRHGYDVVLKQEIPEELRQMADDQRGMLQGFYDSIEAGHAIDQDLAGGMRLLVSQVMDAHGKGYAAHHVIWSRTPQGLRARLVFVPAWFFEATEGRLRFLRGAFDTRGVELDEMGGRSAWMISRGRGIMPACAIARMFKQIPLQDWLTYCDRHGMPAFIGKTGAAKGSTGWQDLYEAVTNIGSEFGAVMNTGDSIDVLSLTAAGDLPYEKLIDRMDRAIVRLWRGGDLSTMSRDNGTGSNPQSDETDELDADNAAWVGETIDRVLTRQVVADRFGPAAPVLVELQIRTAVRQDVTKDLEIIRGARDMGVPISKSWVVDKLGLVLADDEADTLAAPKPAVPPVKPLDPGNRAPAGDGEDDGEEEDDDDEDSPVAINSTPELRALIQNSLAKALGVRPAILAPIRPLIDDLADRSQDARIDDAAFLQLVEDAAMTLPELFDPALAAELGRQLEAAMGTAALQGVRDVLRKQSATNPR